MISQPVKNPELPDFPNSIDVISTVQNMLKDSARLLRSYHSPDTPIGRHVRTSVNGAVRKLGDLLETLQFIKKLETTAERDYLIYDSTAGKIMKATTAQVVKMVRDTEQLQEVLS